MAAADAGRGDGAAPPPQYDVTDLTNDRIDWDNLHAADLKTGREYAMRRGWDPDTFVGDGRFCAACTLHSLDSEASPFNALNQTVFDEYRRTKMVALLEVLQKQYIERQYDDMSQQSPVVKWWPQRQIYEHLHAHNLTDAVRLFQDYRNGLQCKNETFASRVVIDALTQTAITDFKKVAMWTKLVDHTTKWAALVKQAFSNSDKRFF